MITPDGATAADRGRTLRQIVVVAFAGLSLAACATARPELAVVTPPPVVVTPPPPPPALEPVIKPKKATASAPAKKFPKGGRYKIGSPYKIAGVRYVPAYEPDYDEVGVASWYGDEFHGRSTANGERFDMYVASAAHTTLPLPSIVEVTNLENGRSIRVRLNDRGPFKNGRIIDLSRNAAKELGYMNKGLAKVRVRYIGPAKLDGSLAPLYVARSRRTEDDEIQLASAAPAKPARPAPARPKAEPQRLAMQTVAYRPIGYDSKPPQRLAAQTVGYHPIGFDSKLPPLW
jgi:rare lipoprotein A